MSAGMGVGSESASLYACVRGFTQVRKFARSDRMGIEIGLGYRRLESIAEKTSTRPVSNAAPRAL